MRDLKQGPKRVAFLGGIYSNYLALEEALRLAKSANVDAIWALGDFGAFGPHPDRTCEILREHAIPAIQGNYEESLSTNAEDCHCGYTDPRDNHFAQISYDYTFANTSREHKEWMATLPTSARVQLGAHRLLLAHGSPRKINEFLWRSTTPVPFVERMLHDHDADVVVCTHTGIHWSRLENDRGVVNVGALGRPANDGKPNVWFAILDASAGELAVEFVPVHYDHVRLAREMREEGLPQEFVTTILEGWWTTCLEILPAKERATGRY
jgi:diadenosine tetraphosphatase ApaH/serine/threonine PP2A family protein phosphatase